MTDPHLPFLRAICARPEDDLPRLQYADWLDEHGDAERAECIRVQCKIAEYDKMSFADCPDCEAEGQGYQHDDDCPHSPNHALRRRERELLAAHCKPWGRQCALELRYSDGGIEIWGVPSGTFAFAPTQLGSAVFHRGFVESITCSWSDFRTHADAIRDRTPLRRVRITDPDAIYILGNGTLKERLAKEYPGIEFESRQPTWPLPLHISGATPQLSGPIP